MRGSIVMLTGALMLGGCLPAQLPDDPLGSLERAERARDREARTHPECRDSRVDRRDQNEGCDAVVRRQ